MNCTGGKAGTPFSNWHVQQTLCFCSFRTCRILATVALSWSSCSSWLMMPNRLLQEISQTDNYIEAACCHWHSNVFAWAIPCQAAQPRHILGYICFNTSCTLFHTLSFGTIQKKEVDNMSNVQWFPGQSHSKVISKGSKKPKKKKKN